MAHRHLWNTAAPEWPPFLACPLHHHEGVTTSLCILACPNDHNLPYFPSYTFMPSRLLYTLLGLLDPTHPLQIPFILLFIQCHSPTLVPLSNPGKARCGWRKLRNYAHLARCTFCSSVEHPHPPNGYSKVLLSFSLSASTFLPSSIPPSLPLNP